jgi:peptide/nickel transport system permease protein
MRNYIIRRSLLNIPVLLFVVVIVFLATRAIPGDYAESQIALQFPQGGANREESLRAARERLGLDMPIYEQLGRYLGDLLQGDLGTSFRDQQGALHDFDDALPVSIQLAVMTLFFALLISIPVGIISAIRQDSWLDVVLRFFAIVGLAAPSFWIATMGLLLVVKYEWWTINLTGTEPLLWDSPGESIKLFIIPAIAGGFSVGAGIMRLLRSQMLEVLRQDYVRTAWSKGLKERNVVLRHTLRNAMIPVMTVLGLTLSTLISGQLILEILFNIDGVGQFAFDAIQDRDYPVIQAFVLVTAAFLVFINLLVDLSYAWLDPRIRYS